MSALTSKVVAVLGSGNVGDTLANGFLTVAHTTVIRGTRDPVKVAEWLKKAGSKASIASFAEASAKADIIVLAVKGGAAEELVKSIPEKALAGKVVIDATNPTSDSPPENGVVRYFTDINESLMERLQKLAPKARFVKAFSCVGLAFMVNPPFSEKPTMFICGNDSDAKIQVTEILTIFGWETADMGFVESARAIEPLAMLWISRGMVHNKWNHAFRMVQI